MGHPVPPALQKKLNIKYVLIVFLGECFKKVFISIGAVCLWKCSFKLCWREDRFKNTNILRVTGRTRQDGFNYRVRRNTGFHSLGPDFICDWLLCDYVTTVCLNTGCCCCRFGCCCCRFGSCCCRFGC